MKIVFSFGGSILAPDKIDDELVNKVADFLKSLLADHMVAVVVGGGAPARRRIKPVRESGASEAECDYEGILASRENASALANALGDSAVKLIPESVKEAVDYFTSDRILVMGGTEPGHSTDAVAALLAEWLDGVFINASNVDAVYDKNPKDYSDAKPLVKINIDDLTELLSGEGVRAGEYALLDPMALKLMKRSKIKSYMVDGRDLDNIKACIDGKEFTGTEITY